MVLVFLVEGAATVSGAQRTTNRVIRAKARPIKLRESPVAPPAIEFHMLAITLMQA